MFKPLLKVVVVLSIACGTSSAFANDSRAQTLLAAIAKARVIDLSHAWDSKSPIASVNPPFSMALAATHGKTRGMFKDGDQLSFAAEKMEWSGQHGAPSIDAIGHIGRDGRLYSGVDAAAATSDPAGIGARGGSARGRDAAQRRHGAHPHRLGPVLQGRPREIRRRGVARTRAGRCELFDQDRRARRRQRHAHLRKATAR